MVRCRVISCPSDSEKKVPGVSFHAFPSDPDLRTKWIEATGRQDWTPTKHCRLCSNHFLEKQLIKMRKKTLLYPDAVPTANYQKLEKGVSQITKVNMLKDKAAQTRWLNKSVLSETPQENVAVIDPLKVENVNTLNPETQEEVAIKAETTIDTQYKNRYNDDSKETPPSFETHFVAVKSEITVDSDHDFEEKKIQPYETHAVAVKTETAMDSDHDSEETLSSSETHDLAVKTETTIDDHDSEETEIQSHETHDLAVKTETTIDSDHDSEEKEIQSCETDESAVKAEPTIDIDFDSLETQIRYYLNKHKMDPPAVNIDAVLLDHNYVAVLPAIPPPPTFPERSTSQKPPTLVISPLPSKNLSSPPARHDNKKYSAPDKRHKLNYAERILKLSEARNEKNNKTITNLRNKVQSLQRIVRNRNAKINELTDHVDYLRSVIANVAEIESNSPTQENSGYGDILRSILSM